MSNVNNPFGSPISEKHGNMRQWMRAIDRDRNYCRLLFGLPLIEPVRPAVREFEKRLRERR